MPQFSTDEHVSIDKDVDIKGSLQRTDPTDISDLYEVQKCVDWIEENHFETVCLQFPDHLLPDAATVTLALQNRIGKTVYVLGDTEYESCCIDYVAAAHVNADAIIHYGSTCLSKAEEVIPYLNVYEKLPLDVLDFKRALTTDFEGLQEDLVILLDDAYIHCYNNMQQELVEENISLKVCRIDQDDLDLDNLKVIFITSNKRKLFNIGLTFDCKSLFHFDPCKLPYKVILYDPDGRVQKRRYFLMEKIRDANTIGIVIGTLAVKNYLQITQRLKRLAELNGKKYYLISVGKPTVAKLANIGEIDVYVLVTCSMNEIYDSRDYYKPIATPYDVELALNPNSDRIRFSYDYNKYLSGLQNVDDLVRNSGTDVSLLTGKLRSNDAESIVEDLGSEVALKSQGSLSVSSHSGANYLMERSWKGLQQDLGLTEVKLAEEGRKGIAQGYENEAQK